MLLWQEYINYQEEFTKKYGDNTICLMQVGKFYELYSLDNPYGKKGFMSVQWWYGFMLLRGERLALIKTVGRM